MIAKHVVRGPVAVFLGIILLGAAAPVSAQNNQTGNIHGTVTDQSAGAIPGATVTLTSPALLVAQTTVTDSDGNYHFEQLPVGSYKVTCELSGFKQYIRENIQITAGFSAAVNVQMSIGALEENITVSAAGPVVDTTSTTVSTSVSAEIVANQLPATRTMQEMVSIAPGVMPTAAPDLGGGKIATFVLSAYGITGQSTALVEGLNTRKSNNNSEGNYDFTAVEEMQIVPTGGDAQTALPGVFLNTIIKSGGNTVHGRAEANFEDQRLQADNLTPALQVAPNNYAFPAGFTNARDASGSLGGPIVQNKWWYFGAYHINTTERTTLGYTDASGNPINTFARMQNQTVKSTYQLNSKVKFIGFYSIQEQYFPFSFGSNTVTMLNTRLFTEDMQDWKGEIQATPTNDLVIDFFAGHHQYLAQYYANEDPLGIPTLRDIATGVNDGPSLGQDRRPRKQHQITGSLSYFPKGSFLGHHELKAGSTWMLMWTATGEPEGIHGNYRLVFNTVGGVTGQPVQIEFFNYPLPTTREDLNEGGVFFQDTWRIGPRLVANVGIRYDRFHTFIPPQNKPAGDFGPPWQAPAAGTNQNVWTGPSVDLPYLETGTWWGLAPRVGVVWDLTGDGKTVLKGNFGRYHWTPGDDFGAPFNVNATIVSTYKWTSAVTSCTEAVARQGKCDYIPGQVNLNPNGGDFQSVLGGSNGATVKLSNTVMNPNSKEQYTNEYQIFLEREIGPGLSTRGGITYIDNRNTWLQTPTQVPYNAWNIPYTVHDGGPGAPSCLPTATVKCSTSGTPMTIYDMDPLYKGAAYTQVQYLNMANTNHYSTIEVGVTKRPASGSGKWSVMASYTRTKNYEWLNGTNNSGPAGNLSLSAAQTSPNQTAFALNTTAPFTFRLTGNYKLPAGLDVSATFNVYNGLYGQRTETYNLPNAGTLVIPVEAYGAEVGPLRELLNLRFARNFKVGRTTLRPNMEILNVTNSASPWTIDYKSGTTWQRYSAMDSPRIARIGVVCEF